jgi:hypothetical protein
MEMADFNASACPLPRRHLFILFILALSCLQMLSLSRKRNSPSGNRVMPKLQALLHAR